MEPKDVFTCRGVLRAHGFDDAAAPIFGSLPQADDALGAIEFTLARHPAHGQLAGEHGGLKVYAIRTRASAIGPAVIVYYSIDIENVHLLFIERVTVTDEDL